MKTRTDLGLALIDQGWSVGTIKFDQNCYVVTGFAPTGDYSEGYFNPRSLEQELIQSVPRPVISTENIAD
mgnify:CR=1 FL=1